MGKLEISTKMATPCLKRLKREISAIRKAEEDPEIGLIPSEVVEVFKTSELPFLGFVVPFLLCVPRRTTLSVGRRTFMVLPTALTKVACLR